MRIRGKDKFTAPQKVVQLFRTTAGGVEEILSIQVTALPMGSEHKMFELFPDPPKPQDYAKSISGGVLRDPDTKKPVICDIETPDWLQKSRELQGFRLAYVLYNGINDPEVELPQGDKNKPELYQQFYRELVEFGFTIGDLGLLMSEITSLTNNISDDVEDAKGN